MAHSCEVNPPFPEKEHGLQIYTLIKSQKSPQKSQPNHQKNRTSEGGAILQSLFAGAGAPFPAEDPARTGLHQRLATDAAALGFGLRELLRWGAQRGRERGHGGWWLVGTKLGPGKSYGGCNGKSPWKVWEFHWILW